MGPASFVNAVPRLVAARTVCQPLVAGALGEGDAFGVPG